MIKRKENGFSLVEVMILFVVMSAILAASIPLISRHARSAPVKIARGAYICYMDNQGNLHEAKFNKKQLLSTRQLNADEVCTFKPIKQSASYQLTLIGGGAGGYDYSKVSNYAPDKITYFTMLNGYSGYGVEDGVPSWDLSAENKDGTVVGVSTDDDLWTYYKDKPIRLSARVPKAGNGQGFSGCFRSYDRCSCKDQNDQPMSRPIVNGVYKPEINSLYSQLLGSNLCKIEVAGENEGDPTTYRYYYNGGNGRSCDPITSQHVNITSRINFENGTYNGIRIYQTGDNELLMPQRKKFCESASGTGSFGWGGRYFCECEPKQYDGQQALAAKYLEKDMLITTALMSVYKSGTYEEALKLIASQMEIGSCSNNDASSCTFSSTLATDGTNGGMVDLSSTRPTGNSIRGEDGGAVALRTALTMPNPEAIGKLTYFIKSTAKGGRGALIQYISSGTFAGSYDFPEDQGWYNDTYLAPQKYNNDVTLSDSSSGSYRQALKFVTNLNERRYTLGSPGGNGQVKITTKTVINGECNMEIGKAGEPTYSSEDNFGNGGNTRFYCSEDGYEAIAYGGTISAITKSHSYMYSKDKKDQVEYSVSGIPQDYIEPVALKLLRDRDSANATGLAGLNLGMGGRGTAINDKCIKPNGTFSIYKYNEFDETSLGSLLSQVVYDNHDDCLDGTNDYGTKLINVTEGDHSSFTSQYIDVSSATEGTNGAVIITW